MKKLPPHMLVKTWLQLLESNKESFDRQRPKLNKCIYAFFGSKELANLYVEQMNEDIIEDYFV